MNRKQKTVIWCAIFLILFLGLVPPWAFVFQDVRRGSAGYSLIFSPPQLKRDIGDLEASLDVTRLLIEWATVAIVAAGLVWVLKDMKS